MRRFWTLLFDTRVIGVIGLIALAAFLFLGAKALEMAVIYAVAIFGAVLVVWLLVWAFKRWSAYRASRQLENAIENDAKEARDMAPSRQRQEFDEIRKRMDEAVKTIKTSRLGQTTGRAALYELPWYMVIGNPAAGKSTAVVQSGLKFPFADKAGAIIQGIGGTRNCDWFFTTEGILLDTAGRYSVHEEDRSEWLGFLSLLKKHRKKAPINGILMAVSVAELANAKAEHTIQLAKNLRQRVQELTEELEIFAPVYVLFTKADLISGFQAFFDSLDPQERDRVWGATLPYDPEQKMDVLGQFDKHFDELREGLTEQLLANMSLSHGRALPASVLSFPLEFAALKPNLKAFLATLFEDNPYQFRPIFRGFYFSSSVQEGEGFSSASEAMAQHFELDAKGAAQGRSEQAQQPYFLRNLFSKVVFADKELVKQYTSRRKRRLRAATFATAVLVLALALGGWASAYLANRQLMQQVAADLDRAIQLQGDQVDLAGRMEAMTILHDRIRQLEKWKTDRPLTVSMGLYQGDAIEAHLRQEYFRGVEQLMLRPVTQAIEKYLAEVNSNAGDLQPMTRVPESAVVGVQTAAAPAATQVVNKGFVQASSTNVEDAYNALKTYLMLADRQYMESGHLVDQITRFWRGWLEQNRGSMPMEQLIQRAEQVVSFSIENLHSSEFPLTQNNLALLDETRENLRKVVRGMPARERVYSNIKARASTRFPSVTVASLVGDNAVQTMQGSYAISGAFTRNAWTEYVEAAIKQAADEELQSVDWVLRTASRDDLSLEGSPDQIRKTLTDMYKNEYVAEWQRFLKGISITEFATFEEAARHMDVLGDPTLSPIRKLMEALYDQTSWDNPSLLNERLARTQQGFMQWFKQTILRQAPSRVEVNVNLQAGQAAVPVGPIGKEFQGLQRIMMSRDSSPTMLAGYLTTLSQVRSKFNQIKNQGDPGPAVKALMSQTLLEGGSELAAVLKYVDEQMLVGLSDSERAAYRPLLLRPLVGAFAAMKQPVETEINRIWTAQVYEPFQKTLADKYPFDKTSRTEAAPADIAKVFGAEGAIAKFANEALGPLVIRRGDAMVSRTWADHGISLAPEFETNFGAWVTPVEGAAAGASDPAAAARTVFQVLPQGVSGLLEYTIEIDGQQLRYRNTAASWTNFFWPNPGGVPGVRISAVTNDGRTVEIFNEPGAFGLERLFSQAKRERTADGNNQLSWTKDGQTVTIWLRVISQPGAQGTGARGRSGMLGLQLPSRVVGNAPVAPAVAAQPGAGS